MNSKRVVTLVVAVIVTVAGILIIKCRPDSPRIIAADAKPDQPSVTPSSDSSPSGQDSNAEQPLTQDARGRRLRDVRSAAIRFFGRVVDESGSPVANASVRYIVGSLSFKGSPTKRGPASDADGRFVIENEEGPDLTVAVEHPGYYSTSDSERHFNYGGSRHRKTLPEDQLPSQLTPARFVLQKKGAGEPLIHHNRIEARLPMNGEVVAIDLNTGARLSGPDSLSIALTSTGGTLPPDAFYPFDWRLQIRIDQGGISERNSSLTFVAPEGGYADAADIAMPASLGKPSWKSIYAHEFFARLPSGRHARIKLHVSAVSGLCIIESFLNPRPGSRNLEYDPNNQAPSQQ